MMLRLLCLLLALNATHLALAHSGNHVLDRVGIDEHLGQSVPVNATFRDENGLAVELSDYLGKRPLIAVLAYYNCPNLCTLVVNGLIDGLRRIDLTPGVDFDVVVVSIDPRDTPALAHEKKRSYLEYYGRDGSERGWHFLSGAEKSIRPVAAALGFRYYYDEEQKEYAHAAGMTMLTPQGRIARYFYGVQFPPTQLRQALLDASADRVSTLTERLLFLCFHYDPRVGEYGELIENSMRALALLTVLALVGFVLFARRRKRMRAPSEIE